MKRQAVTAEVVDGFVRASVPVAAAADHRAGGWRVAAKMLRRYPSLGARERLCGGGGGRCGAAAGVAEAGQGAGGEDGWGDGVGAAVLCVFFEVLRFGNVRRRRDFLACARMLLKAGRADANSAFINAGDGVREAVLYGAAGVANDAALTRLLLRAGADVNDGETVSRGRV